MPNSRCSKKSRRRIRSTRPTFYILCEGDTENNYFNGMKKREDLSITLETVPMKGGGYNNFLEKINASGSSGYICQVKNTPNFNSKSIRI
ncbi:MAG: hypothetical protein ACPKM0_06165 [Pleomorphochaeta sp.]